MGMVTEDYVSFETAKLLKERGFPQEYDIYHSMVYNEEDYEDECEVQRMVVETRFVKAGTLSSYPVGVPDPKCYCPTLQMAMKWLREVHNWTICISPYWPEGDMRNKFTWYYAIHSLIDNRSFRESSYTDNYTKACEAAIKYCLENLI